MLNQTFSLETIQKINEQKNVNCDLSVLEQKLANISSNSYEIILKHTRTLKPIYLPESNEDYLILEKMNFNIKRIYKVRQSNRDRIVQNVITLLNETKPHYLYRFDIQGFYENICMDTLLQKITNDQLVSRTTINLLKQLKSYSSGLLRGISLSSTLSELAMRKSDFEIRRMSGIYFYARFVDDIIIFSNEKIKNITSEINKILGRNSNGKLKIHMSGDKFQESSVNDGSAFKAFNYLGYTFNKLKRKEPVKISLAENKFNKYKKRLKLTFIDYYKYKDENLLLNRIEFLTANYYLSNKKLCSGIYYNYRQMTDLSMLRQLNNYLYATIRKNVRKFSTPLFGKLMKHNFISGFNFKITRQFSTIRMNEIKKVWKYNE